MKRNARQQQKTAQNENVQGASHTRRTEKRKGEEENRRSRATEYTVHRDKLKLDTHTDSKKDQLSTKKQKIHHTETCIFMISRDKDVYKCISAHLCTYQRNSEGLGEEANRRQI